MTEFTQSKRFLGITVLGDFILSEGIDPILNNLHRAGATAVACNPTVTVEADEGQGSFQPPSDAGASPRRFDRPVFGKHALWVRSGPSYHPNAKFYRDSPYGPRQANDLTEQYGSKIGEFIDAAIASGLKVYLQLGAAQPSGLRDEDRPQLPDGRLPEGRMANTGSLASEAVRAYNQAQVADLLETYPNVSGFRPDWPESPCYTLGEVFQDFSPHARAWAEREGWDFELMQREVAALYKTLHGGLAQADVAMLAEADRGHFALLTWLNRCPGVAMWLRFKAALSVDLLRDWRAAIDAAGGTDKELGGHAFMAPYSLLTGFDYRGASAYCDTISPKLYTMHWPLMVKFWGEALLAANPQLDERSLVRALVHLMDLADGEEAGQTLADYQYPLPDQPHQIPLEPQRRKIEQAIWATDSDTPVFPLAHGYGPLDDFSRRFQLIADSPVQGAWINRYGYLSDEKLQAIGKIWK